MIFREQRSPVPRALDRAWFAPIDEVRAAILAVYVA